MIPRYRPDKGCMVQCDKGTYVSASDYDMLRLELIAAKAENDRLRELLRDVVNNPVIFKLPRDYSPLTEELNNRIDAALKEGS